VTAVVAASAPKASAIAASSATRIPAR
jgi:hypothetical protein